MFVPYRAKHFFQSQSKNCNYYSFFFLFYIDHVLISFTHHRRYIVLATESFVKQNTTEYTINLQKV